VRRNRPYARPRAPRVVGGRSRQGRRSKDSTPVEFRLPVRRLCWSASDDHVVGLCGVKSVCACMRAEVHADYKAFVLVESKKRPRQASKTATVSSLHCAHRVSLHHHILYSPSTVFGAFNNSGRKSPTTFDSPSRMKKRRNISPLHFYASLFSDPLSLFKFNATYWFSKPISAKTVYWKTSTFPHTPGTH
jgi:hypothetical protein